MTEVKTEAPVRTMQTVSAELEAAEADLSAQQRRVSALRDERDKLAVEGAAHPWLGKAVKRTTLTGYGRTKKPMTNRGTVAAYDPKLHRHLRSLGGRYGMNAGDPIVIHPGGATGWKLLEHDWTTRQEKCVWELDEA